MTDLNCIYVVYMDKNIILGTSTVEEQAYELIRTEAIIHQESQFMIQKTETVFDSVKNPRDKLSLQMVRNPRKSNAVHVSIHPGDRKVGWENASTRYADP
jgi:hypothetical protein